MANKAAWTEEFAVATSVLCAKTGLSRRAIYDARNELKTKGRLDWRSRKGNQSSVYRLIPLCADNAHNTSHKHEEKALCAITARNGAHNASHNTAHNGALLNKLNETKLNNINNINNISCSNEQEPSADAGSAGVADLTRERDSHPKGAGVADTSKKRDSHLSDQPTNRELIAELVDAYRQVIPPEKHQKGDYPFIGRLYNEHGYDAVLLAINELGYRTESGFVPDNPLIYLKAILEKKKIHPAQQHQHQKKMSRAMQTLYEFAREED